MQSTQISNNEILLQIFSVLQAQVREERELVKQQNAIYEKQIEELKNKAQKLEQHLDYYALKLSI
jgi:uncharacterized membrane protein YgaE (UPF0421/DUF939 family)